MRVLLISIAVTVVSVRCAGAQAAVSTSRSVSVLGTWRGTSVCLVRPSPCNNEIVVYRITPRPAHDSVAVDARKIVRGQEEEMGVLTCRLASATAPAAEITCAMPNGVWRFRVRGDTLLGELRLPDSTRFRDVRAAREPKS